MVSFRYLLAGALVGMALNVTYSAGWRFGGSYDEFFPPIRIHPSFSISLQNVLINLVAALIGTYVGLWTIGKIKLASPFEGVIAGLLVFAISIPITQLLFFILYVIYAIPSSFFVIYLKRTIVVNTLESVLGCLFGGFLGGILVHFVAPKYCPKCKAKLSTGVIYCANCGWGKS